MLALKVLEDIQVLLQDDGSADGIVHPASISAALKLNQQIKTVVSSLKTSLVNDDEISTDALEAIFEQLQVTSSFLLAMEDLRIKNQLSDLIENVVTSLLSPSRILNVWQYIISPIANSSIYYIVSHLSRKVVKRPTALGSTAQIDMDDTTGWEDLELNIKIYEALIRASLPYNDVVTSLWTFPVYEQSVDQPESSSEASVGPKPAWHILLHECGHHINRHLREGMYHFLSSLLQAPAFKAAYLSCLLSDPQATTTSSRWIDVIMTILPSGLEDDWTQIRYAAAMVLQHLLEFLSRDDRRREPDAVNADDILRAFAPSIVPRLCVNRFHTAPSVQTASKHIWQTFFFRSAVAAPVPPIAEEPLGKQLLLQHVKHAIDYYTITMSSARNHMVCEAAVNALSEITLRLNLSVIRPFQRQIHEALLGCLNDERWPVKDAACLASGRILRRFPPLQISPVTNEVGALDMELTNQFLHHWEEHLRDCIWSVRENAAFACAEALVTDTFVLDNTTNSTLVEATEGIEQWRRLVWRLVSQFIQQHLLTAVGDVDESVDIVLPSTVDAPVNSVTVQRRVIQSKIESFLPIAMVEAHEQKKRQSNDVMPMSTPENDEGLAKAADSAAQSYRKGWGCCVDCVNLREPFSWEVTQGALYLLREVCTLTQRCRGSSSCDVYTEAYLQQQELLAVSMRKSLLQQSWAFQIRRSGSSYEKRNAHGSSYCVGLFALLELLRTEVDNEGTGNGGATTTTTTPADSLQPRIRHPVKNIERLHPAVYEELPEILDGLALWNVLLSKENDPVPTGLSSSLLTSFWQETMTFLCRDLLLTDDESNKTATRQARSATASRRFAAEKCFTRLFDQFKAIRRKVDNQSEDGYRWEFLRLFVPDVSAGSTTASGADSTNSNTDNTLTHTLKDLLFPENRRTRSTDKGSSSFVRRISAEASVQRVTGPSTTSALITTDVLPNMVPVLVSGTATHNVVGTAVLADQGPLLDVTSSGPGQTAPRLFFHPTEK